jgi:hypothetical protein
MDVEKTIEFILQQQARFEAKAEARAERYEAKQAQAEAKAERQMAAIRKLIQTGMRMIVKNEELVKATQAELRELAAGHKELAAAQKVTETKLQGLIDAMRRGRNGSHRKN